MIGALPFGAYILAPDFLVNPYGYTLRRPDYGATSTEPSTLRGPNTFGAEKTTEASYKPWFVESHWTWDFEPGCRILMFTWSVEPKKQGLNGILVKVCFTQGVPAMAHVD